MLSKYNALNYADDYILGLSPSDDLIEKIKKWNPSITDEQLTIVLSYIHTKHAMIEAADKRLDAQWDRF